MMRRPFPSFLFAAMLLTAGVAHAGSVPQMDVTWYPGQLLWLGISFALLYLLVSCFISPTIGGVLKAREVAIANAIREAETAKQTTEATRSASTATGQHARLEISEMLLAAQTEQAKDAAAATAKLDHHLAHKAEQATTRIAVARANAERSLEAATLALAGAMVEKLLGRPAPESALRDAVVQRSKR